MRKIPETEPQSFLFVYLFYDYFSFSNPNENLITYLKSRNVQFVLMQVHMSIVIVSFSSFAPIGLNFFFLTIQSPRYILH